MLLFLLNCVKINKRTNIDMSTIYSVKKGLDIKLIGEANKRVVDLEVKKFAVKPPDFIGCFPKVLIKEGEEVKAGTPLFYDKYRKDIIFTSPVSGKFVELRRGAKRKILELVIESDGKFESIDFGKENLSSVTREKVIDKLLKSGVWSVIRQRPYAIIANPKDNPKSIFVTGFDTAPLAPDYDILLEGKQEEFQAGLDILTKLTDGKVHLNVHSKLNKSSVLLDAKNVQLNTFDGPHPSGNVSVHINRIDPINKGDVIWYINAVDVVTIGKLFITGLYDSSRIIALTGSEVKNTGYYKTHKGASITKMITGNLKGDNNRYISGNVLTGTKVDSHGFIGFYDSHITVIPEGDYYEFFGWAKPGFGKWSFSKSFPAGWIKSNKGYRLDTNTHGGKRAFVVTGLYEKVFPFDIYPMHLMKAILVEDIDLMENLGIYEIDAEDFALCEVIDPSKIDMQEIVRNGLELMRREMS
jgi:Na+-transporting NADH:ubiquinone oxidoreductase subunit A